MRFETESVTLPPRSMTLALASSREHEASVPVITNVRPASGPSPGAGASPGQLEREPGGGEIVEHLGVGGKGQPGGDRLGDDRADALDLGDLVRPGGAQGGQRAEVLRDRLGGDRAHVRDAEAEQHAPERPLARARDRRDDVLGRALLEAVELGQLLGGQRIEVGRPAHEAELPEARDQLLAHAVDVERPARDEVPQPLEPAARAVRVDAAVDGLALEAHDLAAAGRAVVGHAELALAAVAPGQDGPDDLRDHVARALDDHVIADAHVLELDDVLVVERRHAHDHAADGDRLEHRERIERAGAPDVEADVEQLA